MPRSQLHVHQNNKAGVVLRQSTRPPAQTSDILSGMVSSGTLGRGYESRNNELIQSRMTKSMEFGSGKKSPVKPRSPERAGVYQSSMMN